MKKSHIRKERKLESNDIINMIRFAKRIKDCDIILIYQNNNLEFNRIAYTLKKGFKSAVHRNRERRIVKECYKNINKYIKLGLDLVFYIFPGNYSYSSRFSQISNLLLKADLLINIENENILNESF